MGKGCTLAIISSSQRVLSVTPVQWDNFMEGLTLQRLPSMPQYPALFLAESLHPFACLDPAWLNFQLPHFNVVKV